MCHPSKKLHHCKKKAVVSAQSWAPQCDAKGIATMHGRSLARAVIVPVAGSASGMAKHEEGDVYLDKSSNNSKAGESQIFKRAGFARCIQEWIQEEGHMGCKNSDSMSG